MKTNISHLNLFTYIIKLVPKYFSKSIQNIKLTDDALTINIDKEYLVSFISFLKNHHMLQYKTLIGITAIDYPEQKERFTVVYFLLSYKLNSRIIISINTSDVEPVESISSIYAGAN